MSDETVAASPTSPKFNNAVENKQSEQQEPEQVEEKNYQQPFPEPTPDNPGRMQAAREEAEQEKLANEAFLKEMGRSEEQKKREYENTHDNFNDQSRGMD